MIATAPTFDERTHLAAQDAALALSEAEVLTEHAGPLRDYAVAMYEYLRPVLGEEKARKYTMTEVDRLLTSLKEQVHWELDNRRTDYS